MSPGIYTDVNLDELGTAKSNGGGASPSGAAPSPSPAPAQAKDETQPIKGAGHLLEADPKAVFDEIHRQVMAQERLAKNRAAAAKHWQRVRRGVPFSTLVKSEDKAEWRAELPPGIDDSQQPIPNKADDLCSKIVSQVVVDPYRPDPKPKTDSDRSRGASDLAKRFLTEDGDESGTNDQEVIRSSLDVAMTHASGFVHLWVDPEGDGWRPLQVKAHPMAQDASQPLVGPDGQPTTDYVLRYVTEGNQFTENPAEAARQWMPKIRRDLLNTAHARTIPETADVSGASRVILLMVAPLADAKRRFSALRSMSPEQLKHLADWRPPRAKALVPDSLAGRFKTQDASKADSNASITDEALIFWYQKYCRQGSDYRDGAEVAVSGADGGMILKRALLRDDVQGEEEATVPILRSIPVAQFKALSSMVDPAFGMTPMERFGAANEARAQLYGGALEDVDRRLHPNTFLPITSPVQSWQLTQRTGEPIPVLSKDDMPKYEDFAELPGFLPDMLAMLDRDMESAAMLSQGMAQNLESPQSGQSGVAKEAVIRQAKVALAPVYQNTTSGVKRYWRLKLELAQAKYTVPQQVKFSGADQAHKQRWWTGSDLNGVGDIAIQPGSGTMMSPTEKQQFLGFAQQSQWLDPEEAAEVGRSTVADDLGLEPNRHEELIGRQLASWSEGPPPDWQPSMPATDEMGAQMVDPMTGQPQMMPPSWTPFEIRPTDDDPMVAPVRYRKLRQFIATADYQKHPPEWRALVDEAYLKSRAEAGVQTMAEQQMAAQQAAEQEAAAAGEERAANQDEAAAGRAHQSEEKDKDRQMKRSESAQDRALKVATQSPQGMMA